MVQLEPGQEVRRVVPELAGESSGTCRQGSLLTASKVGERSGLARMLAGSLKHAAPLNKSTLQA
jgi:hypothetical protein